MGRFFRMRRRVVTAWCVVTMLVAGALAHPASVSAQYLDVFDVAPYEEQVGIEEVIHRLYQGPPSVNMYAHIARFDTAEHAGQGLEALNAWFVVAFATYGDTMALEPAEAATSVAGSRAYFTLLDIGTDAEPYGELALIQAQDDVYVYTVAVNNDYAGDLDEIALEAAVAMIDAIAATPVGEATPSAGFGEPATSGTWAKLPPQEHEVPQRYGITYTEDTVYLAPEPLSESMRAIYGSGDGLVTVVARGYGLGNELEGFDIVGYIEIAAFDDPANAEAVFAQVGPAQLSALGLDGTDMEETTADVSADAVVTYGGQFDNDVGEQFAVAVIVARSGPYVITVVVAAELGSQDALAFAGELTQAVIDAEAGTGDPRYVDWGMSTGGVWDKLPLTGDAVLRDMRTTEDSQLHPEVDDGF